MTRHAYLLAPMLLAAAASAAADQSYPAYTDEVLNAEYSRCIDSGLCETVIVNGVKTINVWAPELGERPTVADIEAAAPAVLRPLCAAALAETLRDDRAALGLQTWPQHTGPSAAGMIAQDIALSLPSSAAVQAYSAAVADLSADYQIDAAAAMLLDPAGAWDCIQTGGR